jgi:cyclophilin family peptidyl-prolyl cis-trans isomerase
MLRPIALICLVAIAALSLAQYKPHKGETDLKLDVQGKGLIFIQLFTKEAPKASAQIVKLVKGGFYNEQRFHKVERTPKPYLIQIGDPQSKTGDINNLPPPPASPGDDLTFEESGHQNVEGAVGLARGFGGTQFYIAIGTDKFLDGHYTVFGQVVSGMDVVQKIELGDRVTSAEIVVGK